MRKVCRKKKQLLAAACALTLAFSFTPIGGYLPEDAGVEEAKADVSGDWEYVVLEDGTVEITGYTGSDTEVEIPAEIDEKSVTELTPFVFLYYKNLRKITIPESVTEIGRGIFDGLQLSEIHVKTENQFYSSKDGSLYNKDQTILIKYAAGKTDTSFTIPDSVRSIEDYAFSNCDSLASIIIPTSVTDIGSSIFWGCGKLNAIEVKSENPLYSSKDGNLYDKDQTVLIQYAIGKPDTSFAIPESVTVISERAFIGCSNLDEIKIPEGVKRIGESAFAECSNLKEVKIPDGVTEIGGDTFKDCRNLKKITIPKGITIIEWGAFEQCTSLKKVTIPDGVISIRENAFRDCSNLSEITLPESIMDIGGYAFFDCENLKEIIIPESVTSIGGYAFWMCGWDAGRSDFTIKGYTGSYAYTYAKENQITFRDVDYPDWEFSIMENGAVKIDGYLGTDMEIEIPADFRGKKVTTVESIGNSSLRKITIPESVTLIETSAFSACNELSEITVNEKNKFYSSKDGNLYDKTQTSLLRYAIGKPDISFMIPAGVTTIGKDAFSNCSNLESITIPASVTSIGYEAFYGYAKLIIKGYTGSYAQNYAKENYIKFMALDRPIPEIEVTDAVTRVELSAAADVVPEDFRLNVQEVVDGADFELVNQVLTGDRFSAFTISLLKDNVKIQPNGMVQVSIPLPAGYDEAYTVVYYIDEDGNKTIIASEIKDGMVVFKTDHFSMYVVAEEKSTESTEPKPDNNDQSNNENQSADTNKPSDISKPNNADQPNSTNKPDETNKPNESKPAGNKEQPNTVTPPGTGDLNLMAVWFVVLLLAGGSYLVLRTKQRDA